ncbi:nucleoporin Nup120/160-domain-containing protein [Phlyctochytrium arcticum]|nr:nucleoporin Nup120/160-domain-containing protein [Phlyctochytrium arcticum]
MYWYIESPFSLDCPNSPQPLTYHLDTSQHPSNTFTDDLPPLSGVIPLSTLIPRSVIVWRLLANRRVLELRRTFTASAASVNSDADQTLSTHDLPTLTNTNIPVHITFPFPVLQTPRICLSDDFGEVHVMAVTADGTFWRVGFRTPDVFYEEGWRRKHVTRRPIQALRSQKPVVVQFPDQYTALVGCASGMLVLLQCDRPNESDEMDDDTQDEEYQERILMEANYIQQIKSATPATLKRLLSPFIGTARQTSIVEEEDSGRQPIALSSVKAYELVLCRDRQLRIWNLKTQSKWRTVPLFHDIPKKGELDTSSISRAKDAPLTHAIPRHYIQVFYEEKLGESEGEDFPSEGDTKFLVAIYVPSVTSAEDFFAIYEGRIDRYGDMQEFEHKISKAVPNVSSETLVDFVVTNKPFTATGPEWSIWGLWEKTSGEGIVRFTELWELDYDPAIEMLEGEPEVEMVVETQWSMVLGPNWDIPRINWNHAQLADISKQMLDEALNPREFSESTLSLALKRFEARSGAMFTDREPSSPKATLASRIERAIDSATDSSTEDALTHWKMFYAICQEIQIQENAPAALEYDAITGLMAVAKRGLISVVRECDPVEVLRTVQKGYVTVDKFLDMPDDIMANSLPKFVNLSNRSLLIDYFKVINWINTHVPDATAQHMEKHIGNVVAAGLPNGTQALAEEVSEKFIKPLVPAQNEVSNFKAPFCKLTPGFFQGFLDTLLSLDDGPDSRDQMDVQTPNSSFFTNAMIASVFQQSSHTRLLIARQLVTVLTFAYCVMRKDVAVDVIGRSFSALHTWSIADIMAAQVLKPTRQLTLPSPKSITGELQKLTLKTESVHSQPFQREQLVAHLLQHHYRPPFDFGGEDYGNLLIRACEWLYQRLGFGDDLVRSRVLLQVANKLVSYGHADAVHGLIFGIPISPAVEFLRGRIWVERSEWEKASNAFENAALKLGEDGPLAGANLSEVLPSDIFTTGITAYYEYVMNLFQRKHAANMVIQYGKLAIQKYGVKGGSHAEAVKAIWKSVFSSSMEAKNWEEAYCAVVAMSDPTTKLVCMRHFIRALCTNGNIKELSAQYTFPDYEDEVENELESMARMTSIQSVLVGDEVNYHRILFCYYIERSDFPAAARIMYVYARRLGAFSEKPDGTGVSLSAILVEQVRSYLAAINALSAVPSEHPWILATVRMGDNSKTPKRRRIAAAAYDPEIARSESAQTVDVLLISDLRREYALALAKLTLSRTLSEQLSKGLPHPEDAFSLYLHQGLYDEALSLGTLFDLDLTKAYVV